VRILVFSTEPAYRAVPPADTGTTTAGALMGATATSFSVDLPLVLA